MMKLFKRIETFSLANGVRIAVLPRAGFSTVIHAVVATGSMHEGKLLGSGASHFVEHMLFQGCGGFPGRSAPESLQSRGASLNAYTTFDHTAVTVRVAPDKIPEALNAVAAMIRAPEIAEAEFEKEREVILRECSRYADQAGSQLFEAARRLSFPRHPIRVPIIGYREKLETLTRDDLLGYHAARYTPDRCLLVAVGNVDPATFAAAAEKSFGSWRRTRLDEEFFPVENSGGRRDTLIFPDPQERLFLMRPMPGGTAKETPALDLLLGMLGSGDASFLRRELVLKKFLAGDLRSFYSPMGASFAFGGFLAETTPDKFDALKKALDAALMHFARTGLTAAALQREKQRRNGNDLAAVNDFSALASLISHALLRYGKADFPDEYRRRIADVSIDEVRASAARWLNPAEFNVAAQRNKPHSGRSKGKKSGQNSIRTGTFAGLRCVTVSRRETPMDNAELVLPGGAIFETPSTRGAGLLFARLLSCGSGKYPETAFLSMLDELGAVFQATAGMNTLAIDVNAPHRNIKKVLALVGSVLAEPGFNDAQFQREKEHLLIEIMQEKSTPFGAASHECRKLLFGAHPYCGSPSEEEIRRLTPEKVRRFGRSLFSRSGSVAGFSGENPDLETGAALFFGNAPWHDAPPVRFSDAEFPDRERSSRLVLPREQLAVVRAVPGIRVVDPVQSRMFSLLTQNENGLFSTLFKTVREREALVYSSGMISFGGLDRGAHLFYALTKPECGKKADALLREEIGRLAAGGVGKAEFEITRERQIFTAGCSVEDPSGELADAVLELFYGRKPETPHEKIAALRAVTCGQFNKTMQKWFRGATQFSVFAGAAEK